MKTIPLTPSFATTATAKNAMAFWGFVILVVLFFSLGGWSYLKGKLKKSA